MPSARRQDNGCCRLASDVEYTPESDRTDVREKGGTGEQTDGRTDTEPLHVRFLLDAASVYVTISPRNGCCRLASHVEYTAIRRIEVIMVSEEDRTDEKAGL